MYLSFKSGGRRLRLEAGNVGGARSSKALNKTGVGPYPENKEESSEVLKQQSDKARFASSQST